jgi:hypothetical protein
MCVRLALPNHGAVDSEKIGDTHKKLIFRDDVCSVVRTVCANCHQLIDEASEALHDCRPDPDAKNFVKIERETL